MTDSLSIRPIAVECGICRITDWTDPVDVTGAEEWELAEKAAALLAPKGWRMLTSDGRCEFRCPACVDVGKRIEEAPATAGAIVLPPYRVNGPCPRCGMCRRIETIWVVADAANDPPCEHLHRRCGRCGYRWAEACVKG